MAQRIDRPAVMLVWGLLTFLLGSAQAGSPGALVIDFEDGSLAGWRVRPGDEAHLRMSIVENAELGAGRALQLEASGWDTLSLYNEQVVLAYDLPEPIPIDSTAEVAWAWWVGDNDENDGVTLAVRFLCGPDRTPQSITWWSHSNRTRGTFTGSDPEAQTVRHRERIDSTCVRRHIAPVPQPWWLAGVELALVFPVNQLALVDDISVGPPGLPPEGGARPDAPAPVSPKATSVLAADLNGDGWTDWLVGQEGQAPVIRLGRSSAAPSRPTLFLPPGLEAALSLESPATGDLNRDGLLDLAGRCGNHLRVFLGLGGGRFRAAVAPELRPFLLQRGWVELGKIHVADLIAEPGPEIAVHRVASAFHDSLFAWTADGCWQGFPLPPPAEGFDHGLYRQEVAVADVDGDLDLDLFACNADLYLQEGGRLRCATAQWWPEPGNHQSGAVFGDIDTDGDMDLILTVDIRTHRREADVSHRRMLVYRNDGDHFTEWGDGHPPGPTAHTQCPLLVDFDLDGDLDLFACRDHRWEPPSPANPRGNLYRENDGTGRLRPGRRDSWIAQAPAAICAIALDADGDGDADLLLHQWENRQACLITNPATPPHPPVGVRVLDRHGAPHAGGAQVRLQTASGARETEVQPPARVAGLVGYRQTGVGDAAPGLPVIWFGCPSAGPYDLSVTFPSQPGCPIVRRGVCPGDRILIVEPAWSGPAGEAAARGAIAWREVVRRAAGLGWPLLLSITLGYGVLLGMALYLERWRWPARAPGVGVATASRSPAGAWILMSAIVLAVAVIAAVPVWPRHGLPPAAGRAAGGGLLAGLGLGIGLASLNAARRRALLEAESRAGGFGALIEALDGFSHAAWMKYLSGLGMLARSLGEGARPELVVPRLQERLRSYDTIIRPQVWKIAKLLDSSGLSPSLHRVFLDDLSQIERSITGIRASDASLPPAADLARIGAAATRLQTTVDRIFRAIGHHVRADLGGVVEHAVTRMREEEPGVELVSQVPAELPPVFGVAGELANILENLLRNGIRAAREAADHRAPRVSLEARVEGGHVVVLVRDSGPGIPADRRDTLLAPRAAGSGQRGRGLPYAARRLQQMDGKIGLLATGPASGTTISISLRALPHGGPPHPARSGARVAEPAPTSGSAATPAPADDAPVDIALRS